MKLRILLFAAISLLSGCAFLEAATGGDRSAPVTPAAAGAGPNSTYLVRVNGVALTRGDVDKRLAMVQILLWLSGGERRVELNEETHIEKWIESELLMQAATRAGIRVSESDAEAELNRLMSGSLQTDDELQRQLGLSGLARADLLAYEVRALTVQRFTEQVIWQGASEVEKQSRLATWLVLERPRAVVDKPESRTSAALPGTYAGSAAPDFTLLDLDGQSRTLSRARGKVVLVNFWATWCAPCRQEMPAIQVVYDDYAQDGLEVWAINVAEDPSEVRRFVTTLRLTFPVLLDPDSKVSRLYRVYALPSSFFIGRDGVIRQVAIGEMSQGSLDDYVKRSLR